MVDPLRHDEPSADPEGRDTRIEELLLAGLDHYFSGEYERAINVWTRVLFLDRAHARARAYIERARSAVAERQREGEELLQTGLAAFQRGDADGARRLLTSAVDRGVAPDEAVSLLDRVERLSTPSAAPHAGASSRPWQPAQSTLTRPPGRMSVFTLVLVLAIGVAAGAGVIIYLDAAGAPWRGAAPASAAPARTGAERDILPLPSTADVALDRARALQGSGRLREALDALEAIRPGDPLRPQADELRGRLQTDILVQVHAAAPRPPGETARR